MNGYRVKRILGVLFFAISDTIDLIFIVLFLYWLYLVGQHDVSTKVTEALKLGWFDFKNKISDFLNFLHTPMHFFIVFTVFILFFTMFYSIRKDEL